MCLIIAKKAGLPLPPDEIISNSWKNNPDGFGLAYWQPYENYVVIRKGAMTLEATRAMLQEVPTPERKIMMLHFRQATEGAISPGNCHPYPISDNELELTATELATKYAVAHNGIIFSYSSWKYNAATRSITYDELAGYLSDTQQFIIDSLVGMGKAIFNQKVLELIGEHTESKFAILAPSRFALIGEFIKKDGYYYSNSGYTPAIPWEPTGGWGDWEYKEGAWHHKDNWRDGAWHFNYCEICGEWAATLTEVEDLHVCPDCAKYFVSGNSDYSRSPYGGDW